RASVSPESLRIAGRVAGMLDLDAVEAERCESHETLARTVATRMGPHGQCACGVCKADRVADVEPRLGNVRALAGAEIPVECIAVIRNVSRTNHRARDVRSSERTPRSLRENVVDAHRHARGGESLDDGVAAIDPLALKAFETGSDCVGVTDVQCKQMHLEVPVIRTELASTYDPDSEARARGECLIVSRYGVVIGDRDRTKLRVKGCLDKLGRCYCSIGCR